MNSSSKFVFNRRGFLLASAATTLLVGTRGVQAAGLGGNGAGCWPSLAPPVAPRVDNWIEQLGRRRNDAYSWMKFIPQSGQRTMENLPPMVAEHLQSEAAYAEAILSPLRERQAELQALMLERAKGASEMPPLHSGEWSYFSYVPEGHSHPVHARRGQDGKTQILVDEGRRAEGNAYYRTTDFQPSPDHRYFAWAEDVTGDDRHRICVLDTQDGTIRVLVDKDAYGYGAVAFSPSGEHLFWIWRDARNRPTRLYRSAIAGGEAVLAYEESDPAIFMQVYRSSAGNYVMLDLAGPVESEIRLIGRDGETSSPQLVRERVEGTTYTITEWDGGLLMLTDMDGAFDRKLVKLDPETFQPVATLVEHRPGQPIISLMPFEMALVRLERRDGLHQLVVMSRDGSERTVELTDQAYALTLPSGQDYGASSVRVGYETPKDPMQWFDIELPGAKANLVAGAKLNSFNPDDYEVERIEAPAEDGEMVPLTVLSRRGTPKDGSAPLLLYGYGAYGISSEPVFSIPATVLVDAGWRYAIAHVRGGSEKGQQWFLDGRRLSKRNSMTDFIACARHLAGAGYCAKDKIAAFGLSAGGLLVGGATNIAPDAFGAVIAKVPFVDMLNTMSDAEHPLVPLFRPDWGDPLADPEAYDYIASISPYENVKPVPYPPLLCTAGLKDDRVPYWEPAKLVAEVRHTSTGEAPAVLLVDPDSGHQPSGGLESEFGEMALFWSFAEFGLSNCAAATGRK